MRCFNVLVTVVISRPYLVSGHRLKPEGDEIPGQESSLLQTEVGTQGEPSTMSADQFFVTSTLSPILESIKTYPNPPVSVTTDGGANISIAADILAADLADKKPGANTSQFVPYANNSTSVYPSTQDTSLTNTTSQTNIATNETVASGSQVSNSSSLVEMLSMMDENLSVEEMLAKLEKIHEQNMASLTDGLNAALDWFDQAEKKLTKNLAICKNNTLQIQSLTTMVNGVFENVENPQFLALQEATSKQTSQQYQTLKDTQTQSDNQDTTNHNLDDLGKSARVMQDLMGNNTQTSLENNNMVQGWNLMVKNFNAQGEAISNIEKAVQNVGPQVEKYCNMADAIQQASRWMPSSR